MLKNTGGGGGGGNTKANTVLNSSLNYNLYPVPPKVNQKNLISSSVRSRRYRRDKTSPRNIESPKTSFTRNFVNIYKGGSNYSSRPTKPS